MLTGGILEAFLVYNVLVNTAFAAGHSFALEMYA